MTITNLKREPENKSLYSLGSLRPLKCPEVYTFDSRSEAICAIILEQYIPGWRVIPGETWQIPLPLGKLADFRVNDTIIEFHPIDFRREFKNSWSFHRFKRHLQTLYPPKAKALEDSMKAEKIKQYELARRELMDNSVDLYYCALRVCPTDESFAHAVSGLIKNIVAAKEILQDWRNCFETV